VDLRAINDAYLDLLKSVKIDRWSRLIGLLTLLVNGFPRPKNMFVFVLVQWNNIRIGNWSDIKISF
jgi:hypothetical protein